MRNFRRRTCSWIILIVTPVFASHLQAANEQRSNVTPLQRPRVGQPLVAARESSAGATRAYTDIARMPLRFERADRSANGAYDFIARGAGYAMFLSGGNATVVLGSQAAGATDVIRLTVVGRHGRGEATGRHELPGRANYFIGNDRREWRTGVPAYREVEYRSVYRGIDLVYHGSQQQLEYDFMVAPGARPADIAFAVDGAEGLSLDRAGNLVISTKAGELIHHAPVIYQEKDGTRQPVRGRYVIRKGLVGFEVGNYDRRRPLVIDPVLSYSTYLGGTKQERSNGVAVDASGAIVVVGETYSADFPAPGVHSPFGDVFVAKLNPTTNQLDYVTYLGGGSNDISYALKLDAAGYAYIAGETFSFDFPTTPGVFQPLRFGTNDSFVVKLNPSGGIVYSTYLGGAGEDFAEGLAVDNTGRVHLAGFTTSGDFPTAHPLQDSLSGNPVLRSTDSGSTWTGLKAGLNVTSVNSFAIDPANPATIYAATDSGVFKSTDGGAAWMRVGEAIAWPVHQLAIDGNTIFAASFVGVMRSQDGGFSWSGPSVYGDATSIAVTPGSPSTVYAGFGFDGFTPGVLISTDGGDTWTDTGLGTIPVVAISVSGTTVYAATQTGIVTNSGGGWSPETQLSFLMLGVAADPSNPAVAYATSVDGLFRTVNGGAEWTPVFEFGGVPAMAVAFAPSNPSRVYVLNWFGLIGSDDGGQNWGFAGAPPQSGFSLAVDPQTPTTVYVGSTLAPDAFVATLSSNGSSLEYSTYFGGSGSDNATDIALDANGGRYITGTTQSTDLPVANALQPDAGGLMDVFVSKIGADGSLAYSTYLAGSQSDYASKVAVDTLGQAHVTGLTLSTNFPVVNAFQPTLGGGFSDVFVSVLNPTGNGLVFSTFLGGNGMENDNTQNVGPSLSVTPDGTTYVAGSTMSTNFPRTADAIQSVYAGGIDDGFVSKISATGQLQFSTLIGGAGTDNVRAIAVDGLGTIAITGFTDSANWPVNNAFQSSYAGSEDAFIATISFAPPDTTPPATSIALSGTPGLAGWYRSAVLVTLSASDGADGTGVKRIEYRVNGGPLQTYGGPFVVAAEGTAIITAQATDQANNIETPPASATVMIDSIAPVIAIDSPQARDYVHSDRVSLSFSATDGSSGVAGTPSALLDGATVAGDAINLLTLALGVHTFTIAAQDVAGNPATRTVSFRVVATIDSMLISLDAFAAQMNGSAYSNLRSKLIDARDALRRGNIGAARNKLDSVVDYCQRQSGKAISVAAAASLIADAQYVLSTL